MTKKFNKEIYKADNSIFSGEITIEDFSTTTPNKNRINNQIEAIKQSKQRKEAQKYKHMTLDSVYTC